MTLFEGGEPRQLLPFDGEAWYHTDVFALQDARAELAGLVEETPWENHWQRSASGYQFHGVIRI